MLLHAPPPSERAATRLPALTLEAGRYRMRFATTLAERETLLRLRYEVFNLELGEGLDHAYLTGKDEDAFDRMCHHLLVEETETGTVVGTYRLQTQEMAQRGAGFYSATEFNFADMPAAVLNNGVELGRACIAQHHRCLPVLHLLWRGIGAYLVANEKRYLFGCCSLTSQDPAEGDRVFRYLADRSLLHPTIRVRPLPDFACVPEAAVGQIATAAVPRLMRVYLNFGASVCSAPAIDRAFKTIDYLVLLDVATLDAPTAAFFLPAA